MASPAPEKEATFSRRSPGKSLAGTLGFEGSMKVGRDATDEQRGRRPIFIATLRAAASWLLFHVGRSLRIDLDSAVWTFPTLHNSADC